jgi:hypothetical protein
MAGPWEQFAPQQSEGGKPWEKFATPEAPKGGFLQGVGNVAAGALRGAGSIGSTLLAPVDIIKDAIDGKGLSLESNRQRRKDIDAGLETLGAQPDSMGYQGGKILSEIAGTMGIPGIVAKGAQAIGAAPKVVSALNSGGFTLGTAPATTTLGKVGNAALRTGAGATVGAATAGYVNPDDAGTGAVIGAAVPGAVKVAGEVGKGIKKGVTNALGASTGTSAETVSAAYQAGKNKSADFVNHMRGNAEFDDVVTSAKQGLEKMRADRAANYRSGMIDIKNDASILNFTPIDDAMNRVVSIGKFKGVQTNKNASGVVDELADTINNWKSLDPAEYHTPEGLDALKRSIGDIRDSVPFGTPARKAADTVYNAVKSEINRQAPTYSKVMGDYATASQQLDEITKALSLGDKASKDTAIRKLQSLMRNNAQSNYGNRLSLANQLEQSGGVEIIPAIAGQAMNSAMPRGMSGAIQKAGLPFLAGASFFSPQLLASAALAPFSSPRLVGETAYALGRATGGTGRLAQSFASTVPQNVKQITENAMRVAPVIGLGSQIDRQRTQ